jgi:hypothetical protein
MYQCFHVNVFWLSATKCVVVPKLDMVNIYLPGVVAAVIIQELFTRNTVVRFRNSLLPLFSQHSLRENPSDWLPKFRGVINELLVTDALCCD